jgi:galactokinase
MALAGQRAENDWVGMACGVMDQMASALGEEGHALLIDCRSLDAMPVPLPAGSVAVVLDTGTRRQLVDSAYNERRAACEATARHLGVEALRDVTPERLEAARERLPEVPYRRARHVVTENTRVLAAAEAMRAGNPERLGALMLQSHESLRQDYEVSSPALDAFVDEAVHHGACYGARMTGAGFGGCAVALVAAPDAEAFATEVSRAYAVRTGHPPQAYVARPSRGAAVVASNDASPPHAAPTAPITDT